MIKQAPGNSFYTMDREGLIAVLESLVAAGYNDTPHWCLIKDGYAVEIIPNMDKKQLRFTISASQDMWDRHNDVLKREDVQDVVAGLKLAGFHVQYSRCFIGHRAAIYITSHHYKDATSYWLQIKGFKHQPVRDLIAATQGKEPLLGHL